MDWMDWTGLDGMDWMGWIDIAVDGIVTLLTVTID